MGNDLNQYRAAIGLHVYRINNVIIKRMSISLFDIIQNFTPHSSRKMIIILIILKLCIGISLLADRENYYMYNVLTLVSVPALSLSHIFIRNITKRVKFSDPQFDLALNCMKTYYSSIILYCHIARMDTNSLQFPIVILLLLCLDIHPNPGQITDYVSIFHLNIRSLRNKIAYLCDIASDYDIVCVTESHLDDSISNDDIHIDGFYPNPFRLDRNAHGGGIVVYVSDNLMVHRLPHLEFGECIWLEVKFAAYSFLICTIYRPPASNNTFWDSLQTSIDNAVSYNPNLALLGDLRAL